MYPHPVQMCVAAPMALGMPLVYLADLLIFHRLAFCGFSEGVALRVAPKLSMQIFSRRGNISDTGILGYSGLSFKCPPGPTVPPTKMFTPSTIPFAPEGSFTCAPITPMSATCTGAHEFGHPVQIIRRSPLGKSSTLSRCSAVAYACFLVSICANPQNCFPGHATIPASTAPGVTVRRCSSGSARRAESFASGTSGKMKFCSTVRRSSPEPYISAKSAMSFMSSACSRPPGTHTPTQFKPSCFCLCTPRYERRAIEVSILSVSASSASSPLGMRHATSALNLSSPISSMSHIILVFCLLPRWP
mmetsp:Transcript_9388/g.34972  ORF Transcript_9388/g.34972 Transcript_9388/m.34972 type:complete len:303 (+) Transcript_9388:1081-1989(+)